MTEIPTGAVPAILHRIALVAVLGLAALLFVACDGDTDDGGFVQTPIDNPSPGGPEDIPTETEDVDVAVEAEDTEFYAEHLQAVAGETIAIRLVNRDPFPHSFLIAREEGGQELFHIEAITGPASSTAEWQVPDEPGEYYFYCGVHPEQMEGTFEVVAES